MSTSRPGPLAPHLAAVTLGVRDIETSGRFYAGLGFPLDVRSDARRAWFQLNGLALCLVQRGLADPELGPGTPGEGLVSLRHAVVASRDIEAILVAVTHAGGRVLRAPSELPWGGRAAWFADPDGHRWEVVFDPRLQRDAHGGAWLRPRERLEALHDDFEDDPFTDDLGDALVTMEEPRDPGAVEPWSPAERPTVLAERPTLVEPFLDEETSDVRGPLPPPRSAPRPVGRPVPARAAPAPRPLPRPRPTVDAPPETVEAEATRPSRSGRALRGAVLALAFLCGCGVAWAVLSFALP